MAQRDDIYYLDHDVMGTSNVNGTLFLDAAISLKTRPYAYIIYGHNMKSGAMFGSLPSDSSSPFFHRAAVFLFSAGSCRVWSPAVTDCLVVSSPEWYTDSVRTKGDWPAQASLPFVFCEIPARHANNANPMKGA